MRAGHYQHHLCESSKSPMFMVVTTTPWHSPLAGLCADSMTPQTGYEYMLKSRVLVVCTQVNFHAMEVMFYQRVLLMVVALVRGTTAV